VSAPPQTDLDEQLAQLQAESSLGEKVLHGLRREDFAVVRATRSREHGLWILIVRFPKEVWERFAIRMATVVIPITSVPRKALHQLVDWDVWTRQRSYQHLFVVVASTIFLRSASLPLREDVLSIFWDLDADEDFVEALTTALPRLDPFDQRGPLRSQLQELQEEDWWLQAHALAVGMLSGRSFGLYGLRKAGKTSLALEVARTITTDDVAGIVENDPEGRNIAAFVDTQSLVTRTVDSLCRSVLAELQAQGLVVPPVASPLEVLNEALSDASRKRRRVCLIFDEYDLLFPGGQGRRSVEGIEPFFGLLRSYAQRTGLLSLLLVGRDPRWATQPVMEGLPNPLLGWLTTSWIKPLSFVDATSLLQRLGRHCALSVGEATARAAWEWSGGHAMLLRLFGSVARTAARAARTQRGGALPATDPVLDCVEEAFVEHDAVLEICREVEQLLTTTEPLAAALLWELAVASPLSRAALVNRRGGRSAPSVRVLRNFGLVFERDDGWFVPRIWRWWSRFVTTSPVEHAG
jgi:hypothetical protein